jgi:hypothetical protein
MFYPTPKYQIGQEVWWWEVTGKLTKCKHCKGVIYPKKPIPIYSYCSAKIEHIKIELQPEFNCIHYWVKYNPGDYYTYKHEDSVFDSKSKAIRDAHKEK